MQEFLTYSFFVIAFLVLVVGVRLYFKFKHIYRKEMLYKADDVKFKSFLQSEIDQLKVIVTETNILLSSTVLNNLELSKELMNIAKQAMISIRLMPDSEGYCFITKYINDKIHATIQAYKIAKVNIMYIYDASFKNMYLNRNELKQYFNSAQADHLIDEVVRINESLYNQFKESMSPFISLYLNNPDRLNEILKKNLLFHIKPNIERCVHVLDEYFMTVEENDDEVINFMEFVSQQNQQNEIVNLLKKNFFERAVDKFLSHLKIDIRYNPDEPELTRIERQVMLQSSKFHEMIENNLSIDKEKYSREIMFLYKNMYQLVADYEKVKKI
jgi:hypothetical protein